MQWGWQPDLGPSKTFCYDMIAIFFFGGGGSLRGGRSIQASFSWLNRETDDYGTHKERRI